MAGTYKAAVNLIIPASTLVYQFPYDFKLYVTFNGAETAYG